ncbi:MAG: hypothetical protein IKZ01_01380 [Anaerotignum sp.]|nr:hypothetical protein [Anaerotignum sp.]MBR5121980.1 hypothetical protein [Anaerotignum sp.]
MAMRAFHISKDGTKTEVTDIVTYVETSGEYRSCSRTCSFGVVHGDSDPKTHIVTMEVGDIFKVIDVDKVMFQGPIWTKQKATDATSIDFTAKDYGVYLTKNKGVYNFNKMTAEAIAAKVCGDFGIKVGSLAITGKPISRIFNNNTLYDIIMTAYTLGGGDKKYFAKFEGELFYVLEKGKTEVDPLESGVNLLSSSVNESLEGMVNRVRVYNKDDGLLKEFVDAENTELYGFFTEVIRISSDDEDFTQTAKNKLKGVERKITVQNFGNSQYITGRKVTVSEPYTGLSGVFFIDGDVHTWKNGVYTNRLTLNFQNMMDEKGSGTT